MHDRRGHDERDRDPAHTSPSLPLRRAVEPREVERLCLAGVVHDDVPERQEEDDERLRVAADHAEGCGGGGDEEDADDERSDCGRCGTIRSIAATIDDDANFQRTIVLAEMRGGGDERGRSGAAVARGDVGDEDGGDARM